MDLRGLSVTFVLSLLLCSSAAVDAQGQWNNSSNPVTGIYYDGGNVALGAIPSTARLRVAAPWGDVAGASGQLSFGDYNGQWWMWRMDLNGRLVLDRFQAGIGWSPAAAFDGGSGSATLGGTTNFFGGSGLSRLSANGSYAAGVWLRASDMNAYYDSDLQTIFRINGSSSLSEAMRITNTGLVGIGTATPDALLTLGGAERFRFSNNAAVRAIDLDFNAYTGAVAAANGANYRIDLRAGQPTHQWWTRRAGEPVPTGTEYARMVLNEAGNLGIGTINPQFRLDVSGHSRIDGDLTVSGNVAARYQDLAEWVPATADLEPGSVVVLNPDGRNEVMASSAPYDTRVAGVVSAQPGVILGEGGAGREMVATTGRVTVRVDASRAPIRVGDLLVTSDKPGVAMKSEPTEINGRTFHQPGTIIGKALEPLAGGTGEILVLLSLQ